jgi:hypothetical protein
VSERLFEDGLYPPSESALTGQNLERIYMVVRRTRTAGVTRSVPPGVTVVGVPARAIERKR